MYKVFVFLFVFSISNCSRLSENSKMLPNVPNDLQKNNIIPFSYLNSNIFSPSSLLNIHANNNLMPITYLPLTLPQNIVSIPYQNLLVNNNQLIQPQNNVSQNNINSNPIIAPENVETEMNNVNNQQQINELKEDIDNIYHTFTKYTVINCRKGKQNKNDINNLNNIINKINIKVVDNQEIIETLKDSISKQETKIKKLEYYNKILLEENHYYINKSYNKEKLYRQKKKNKKESTNNNVSLPLNDFSSADSNQTYTTENLQFGHGFEANCDSKNNIDHIFKEQHDINIEKLKPDILNQSNLKLNYEFNSDAELTDLENENNIDEGIDYFQEKNINGIPINNIESTNESLESLKHKDSNIKNEKKQKNRKRKRKRGKKQNKTEELKIHLNKKPEILKNSSKEELKIECNNIETDKTFRKNKLSTNCITNVPISKSQTQKPILKKQKNVCKKNKNKKSCNQKPKEKNKNTSKKNNTKIKKQTQKEMEKEEFEKFDASYARINRYLLVLKINTTSFFINNDDENLYEVKVKLFEEFLKIFEAQKVKELSQKIGYEGIKELIFHLHAGYNKLYDSIISNKSKYSKELKKIKKMLKYFYRERAFYNITDEFYSELAIIRYQELKTSNISYSEMNNENNFFLYKFKLEDILLKFYKCFKDI